MKYKRIVDGEESTVTVKQNNIGRGHRYTVEGYGEAVDGIRMPSVTGITSATDGSGTSPIARWSVKHALEYVRLTSPIPHDLVKDAKAEPDRILKTAGDRGTRIHKAVESYLDEQAQDTKYPHHPYGNWKNYLTETDDISKLEICFAKIANWMKELEFTIKATEIPVFHSNLAVGGTVDMVMSDLDKSIYVCDYKTGSNIYFKDALQVSAYIYCIASMIGNGIELWDGYSTDIPLRVDELQLGGAVIHIDEDNESVTINHLPESLIGGSIFHHATFLYEAQRYSKYTTVKL